MKPDRALEPVGPRRRQLAAPERSGPPEARAESVPEERKAPPPRPQLLVLQTPPSAERTAEDREFLPAALAIIEEPPSPARLAFLYTLCGLLLVALVWSFFGRLDVYAVAPGKIQAIGRTKVVQPLVAGQVIAVKVKDGDRVKPGDVLIQLDPTQALATQAAAANSLNSARAEVARRQLEMVAARAAKIEPHPAIPWPADIVQSLREREQRVLYADLAQLSATIADLRAQRAAKVAMRDKYVANIAATNALIASLSEHTGMIEKLLKQGWASRAKYLEMLQPVLQAKENLASLQGSLATAIEAISVVDAQIAQTRETFLANNTSKLADAEQRADQSHQELIKDTEKVKDMTLRAPIAGTVQASAVTTIGQVVTTGQQLMQVVPDKVPLEIEAYVLNEDIGFVTAGEPANIKIDTFPYTRYGSIDGTVVQVANDAIPGKQGQKQQTDPSQAPSLDGSMSITTAAQQTQDLVFPVIVKPARTAMYIDGKRIPLFSGMTVTVEIKTESRRVISYILSPLIDVFSTAGHER